MNHAFYELSNHLKPLMNRAFYLSLGAVEQPQTIDESYVLGAVQPPQTIDESCVYELSNHLKPLMNHAFYLSLGAVEPPQTIDVPEESCEFRSCRATSNH